jgi:two-component system sensor kinase FixL
MFGYSAEEMIGRNVGLLMPSPFSEEHGRYLAHYQETGEKRVIGIGREVVGLRRDGTLFPMDLSVNEVREGDRLLFIGIVRDISERTRAEEALRESEQRFAQFMRHLPGVAFIKDIEGRYVYVNKAYEEVSGRSFDDLRGKSDEDVWPPEVAAQLRANDQLVARSCRVLQATEAVPKGADMHHWLVTKFPIANDDGVPSMVGGVAIDITERVRAEDALRELQELAQQRERLVDVDVITAKILHDLANPLAGLSMQAQLILRRARRTPEQPLGSVLKPVEQVATEVQRLDSLIGDLMHFGRDQRLDLKDINVQRLLQEVADLWEPVATGRKIALSVQVSSNVPVLVGDEEKLRRLLDNLVKNAVEAIAQEPGRISIRAQTLEGDRVSISVEDTGPGIAPTLQVFRLFETTKPGGSGLGLAIAKQIVDAHGGQIEFARLQPRGTVFHIALPRYGPVGAGGFVPNPTSG